MDTVRYILALLVLTTLPPALLYWLIIHPFIHFWRRVGPTRTFAAMAVLFLLCMAVLFLLRRPLLAVEFGTHYWLIGLGALILACAIVLAWQRKKQLTFRILAGVPEVSPESHPQELLTEGIYARVRHPRYLEAILGTLAYSLIINYLAIYVLWIISLPTIYLIVLLEERELQQRFGSRYQDYCHRVPRFIPRRGAEQPQRC